MENQKGKNREPRIGKTLREDFHKIKFKDDISSEYKDLKEFFFTNRRKEQLERMGIVKKFFLVPWWLLKALYFKLTPLRRFLLAVGIILMFFSVRTDADSSGLNVQLFGLPVLSGLLFLFILALELKDKLYAKTELEEGRAIQRALMPEPNPIVPGWDIWLYNEPANDVGGDLLDFIKISENKFGISVGDVAGKGLSAALLMAKLQSSVRALAPDFTSLDQMAKKLNEIFHRDSLRRIFASFVYIELSALNPIVKILNAGHIPPILLRGTKTESLPKFSPALGIMEETEFTEQHLELDSGDFILIFSDGLTEARNQTGEFYGENRLLQYLESFSYNSSEELGKNIIDSINSFRQKTKAFDDITIAVIKRL